MQFVSGRVNDSNLTLTTGETEIVNALNLGGVNETTAVTPAAATATTTATIEPRVATATAATTTTTTTEARVAKTPAQGAAATIGVTLRTKYVSFTTSTVQKQDRARKDA